MYTRMQAFEMVHHLLLKFYEEEPSRSLAFLVNGTNPSLFHNGSHTSPAIFQEWEALIYNMLGSGELSLDDVLVSAVAFVEHEIHTFGYCQNGEVNEAGKAFAQVALKMARNREKCLACIQETESSVFSMV
ncbi:MAG: hypothetical protein HFE44_02905 [Oscillospiraceae bacterium]|nr:hypothetical protein [Oscillospiraceae bacterium]